MKKRILTLIVILLFAPSAWAHHFWVVKAGDRFKVLWGHYPETNPYEPGRVKVVKAFDQKGKEIELQRKEDKDILTFSSKKAVSLIALAIDGRALVTTPEGKKRLTKHEAQQAGLQVIDSVYSYQYIKSLFSYDQSGSRPMGMKFELVPQENPFGLKSGAVLPIKVFFEGKPAEGVAVEINNDQAWVKTNRDGLAAIKIGEKGVQVISAKTRIPTKDSPEADFLSYTAILTFEVE